jgi:predicted GNAT family acetyltransferase
MEPEVTDNEPEERYEIAADGVVAGFVRYARRPGLVAFVHTEIDARMEGRGLGSTLLRNALADARERGLAVLPFCPFANEYIKRHAEYQDLVPEGYREEFGLDRRADDVADSSERTPQ